MDQEKENEHDVDKPRTIFVNNNAFQTDQHTFTGAAIKSLATVPADYELFEVRGIHTVPIGNEQLIHIHQNQHFRAIPAGTFGVWQFHRD